MSEWTIWDITENPDKAERAIGEIRGWRNAALALKRQRDDALEQAARTEFDIDRCLKLVRRLSVWLHEVVAGWQCGDVATGGYTEAAMVKECDLLLADFGEAE